MSYPDKYIVIAKHKKSGNEQFMDAETEEEAYDLKHMVMESPHMQWELIQQV